MGTSPHRRAAAQQPKRSAIKQIGRLRDEKDRVSGKRQTRLYGLEYALETPPRCFVAKNMNRFSADDKNARGVDRTVLFCNGI
jgi:hypothetical protein